MRLQDLLLLTRTMYDIITEGIDVDLFTANPDIGESLRESMSEEQIHIVELDVRDVVTENKSYFMELYAIENDIAHPLYREDDLEVFNTNQHYKNIWLNEIRQMILESKLYKYIS